MFLVMCRVLVFVLTDLDGVLGGGKQWTEQGFVASKTWSVSHSKQGHPLKVYYLSLRSDLQS